MLSPWVRSNRR